MSSSVNYVVCPKCANSTPAAALNCAHCGARLSSLRNVWWSLLFSFASFAVLSASFSLFTFKLFDITFNYKPVVNNNNYAPPPEPTPPPEVNKHGGRFIPKAKAKNGKTASMVIYLLDDAHRWRRGSDDTLDNGEKALQFTPDMKQLINDATRIICVGASSEEILRSFLDKREMEEGRKFEEDRAERRAGKIATWIGAALHNPVRVQKLNIGHRDPEHSQGAHIPANETSEQRRVIIILVLKEEEGMSNTDFDEALHDALNQNRSEERIYETILTKYSLTKGQRFVWVE